MGTLFCTAVVSAMDTNNTAYAMSIQNLEIHIFRAADSGTVTASIANTPDETTRNAGGGSWTATPVWDTNISGSNVEIRVTSNPGGGSFSGGIKGMLAGDLRNFDTSNTQLIIEKA